MSAGKNPRPVNSVDWCAGSWASTAVPTRCSTTARPTCSDRGDRVDGSLAPRASRSPSSRRSPYWLDDQRLSQARRLANAVAWLNINVYGKI